MSGHWGTGPKGKATELHSKIVRARGNGICDKCYRADRDLQCAHIVGRRYSATRTDLANAWALCAGCHRRLTEHPDEHVAFAIQTHGIEGYELLRIKAYQGARMDWVAEVARLRAIAVDMGVR